MSQQGGAPAPNNNWVAVAHQAGRYVFIFIYGLLCQPFVFIIIVVPVY